MTQHYQIKLDRTTVVRYSYQTSEIEGITIETKNTDIKKQHWLVELGFYTQQEMELRNFSLAYAGGLSEETGLNTGGTDVNTSEHG